MIGDTHRFKVGDFDVYIFCDADEHFPANRFFPSVPAEEMDREMRKYGYDPEDTGFSMNIVLVQTPQGRVLVDTGLPVKQDLPNSLKAAGIEPDTINRVILTHSDGDHIGGVAYTDDTLTYPNARYTASKAMWEFGMGEANKSEEPNLIARRSLGAIRDRIDLVDGEAEVVPGIHVLPTPGHRAGHLSVLIESKGERLLHLVDAAHLPLQVVHPEWAMRADAQPEVATDTRRKLFDRANREKLLTMTYHFHFPGLGHVVQQDDHLVWETMAK